MKARVLALTAIVTLALAYGCSGNESDGTTGPQGPQAAPPATRELGVPDLLDRASLAEFVALSKQDPRASTKRAQPVDPCDEAELAVGDILGQWLNNTAGLETGSGAWCDATGQAIDDLTPHIEVLEDCPGSQASEAVGIFHDMFELWWGAC